MRLSVQNTFRLAVVLLVAVPVVAGAFLHYRRHQAVDALCRSAAAEFDAKVKSRGIPVKTFVADYSYWDDLVRFMKTKNRSWADRTIASCLRQYATSAAAVYAPDGTLVYGISSLSPGKTALLPEGGIRLFARSRFCHYFIMTPEGPLEIFGATIHPTADSKRLTPPQGYLLAGRLWDKGLTAALGRETGSALRLLSPHEPRGNVLAGSAVTFVKPLEGADGRPVAYAAVSAPVPGNTALPAPSSLPVVVLSALCAAFLVFLFEKNIQRPLKAVADRVMNGRPLPAGVEEKLAPEFAAFVRAFDERDGENRRLAAELASLRERAERSGGEAAERDGKLRELNGQLAALREQQQKAAAVPAGVAEIKQQLELRTAELFVVNELLQREIISEHEHHKAEMLAKYEKEQAQAELARLRDELEHKRAELLAANELLRQCGKKKSKKKFFGSNMPNLVVTPYTADPVLATRKETGVKVIQ